VLPPIEWAVHEPLLAAIERLKRERQAVVLAHNYQTPEIFHGAADIRATRCSWRARPRAWTRRHRDGRRPLHGRDREAPEPREDGADPRPRGRLFAGGVRSPAPDVRLLRQRYPGVPVVTYVNTSAR
jgi:quinolinate synthase